MSKSKANTPHIHAHIHETAVSKITGWRWFSLYLLSLIIRAWTFTVRFEISEKDLQTLQAPSPPKILLFWHNGIFLAAEFCRRFQKGRNTCSLISASKDGAWLAALYQLLNLGVIRGSNSYRGRQALHECVAALEQNCDVAITPDGPRGPRYQMKRGPAFIAAQSKAPILLVAARFKTSYRFNSWDGFHLPLPFSRVDLRVRVFNTIEDTRAAFPEKSEDAEVLTAALNDLNLQVGNEEVLQSFSKKA